VHFEVEMYKKKNTEGEFPRIHLAFGGTLRADNRWVQLAQIIPWDIVEERYASKLCPDNGRPAVPVRVALGALIIKEKLGFSDEETVEQIRENPYLQYFIGKEEYRDEKPFDSSMMVRFRKRLSGKILKEINDLIVEQEVKKTKTYKNEDEGNDPPSGGGNRGTLIVDATCAPEAMRFPHDVTTLDEARRKTEKIIDALHAVNPGEGNKPRTYRKKARKQFLRFIRNRKPRENEIRRAIRTQLQYVERNIRNIKEMLKAGDPQDLTRKQWRDLRVIQEYIRQQRKLYRERTLGGAGRIVSLAKPHVRAIARGKARGMFEFGAKLTVSLVEGYACVERLSWENYNEGTELTDQLESHRRRYGAYPEVVCADKIFRNRENLEYCKERGIRLSGPKLGRPYGDGERRREQRRIERMDESTRQAIEGKFGEVKTRYSLDRIATRLQETSEGAIQMVFLLANLARVLRIRIEDIFMRLLAYLVGIIQRANRHCREAVKEAEFYRFGLCQ
jgi:IS5 family transposase